MRRGTIALAALAVLTATVVTPAPPSRAQETTCTIVNRKQDLRATGAAEVHVTQACGKNKLYLRDAVHIQIIGIAESTDGTFTVKAEAPEGFEERRRIDYLSARPTVPGGYAQISIGDGTQYSAWMSTSGTITFSPRGGSVDVTMVDYYGRDDGTVRFKGTWDEAGFADDTPGWNEGSSSARLRQQAGTVADGETVWYRSYARVVVPITALGDPPGEDDVVEQDPTTTTEPKRLCPTSITFGKFEPTQGVWQKDPFFSDRPGKQLTKVSDTEYVAELPMVTDRKTLVFGDFEHRDFIVVRGRTTGTRPGRARVNLGVRGAGANYDATAPDVSPDELAVFSPCDEEQEFALTVPTPKGLPASEGDAFSFPGTGKYTLSVTVHVDKEELTPSVKVTGTVRKTRSPLVLFVPISLDPTPSSGKTSTTERLRADYVRDLAAVANEHIPDYVPLKPGGFKGYTQRAQYVGDALREKQSSLSGWAGAAWNALGDALLKDPHAYKKLQAHDALEFLSAELVRRLGVQSALSNGTRIVAVLPEDQYASVDPLLGDPGTGSGGIAMTSKVIFLPAITKPPHTEVAHEVTHTLPFLWSSNEMVAECNLDYHDKGGANAFGFQVMNGNREARAPRDGLNSFMSTNERAGQWIDQCTYRHLIDALQQPKDPPVVVVQAMLKRDGAAVSAKLFPAYDIDGVADLDAAPPEQAGGHSIVLRDSSGGILARYPFDPAWTITGHGRDIERNVVAVTHRVPRPAGLASIELAGPDGELDRLALAARAPTLAVTSPAAGTTVASGEVTVPVRWRAKTANGEGALASVFTSTDRGRTWAAAAVERSIDRLDVPLPAARQRSVKVVVTDGTRSTEQVFHLRAERSSSFPWVAVVAGTVAILLLAAFVAARRLRARTA